MPPEMSWLDLAVFPAAAAEVDVAENQEGGGVDVLGTPADSNISFEDACYDGAVECVYAQRCKFEAEGCLGASGT